MTTEIKPNGSIVDQVEAAVMQGNGPMIEHIVNRDRWGIEEFTEPEIQLTPVNKALMAVVGRYYDEQYPRHNSMTSDEMTGTGRITRNTFTTHHISPMRVGRMIGLAKSLTPNGQETDWSDPDFQATIAKVIFPRIKDPNNKRVVACIAFAQAFTQ